MLKPDYKSTGVTGGGEEEDGVYVKSNMETHFKEKAAENPIGIKE